MDGRGCQKSFPSEHLIIVCQSWLLAGLWFPVVRVHVSVYPYVGFLHALILLSTLCACWALPDQPTASLFICTMKPPHTRFELGIWSQFLKVAIFVIMCRPHPVIHGLKSHVYTTDYPFPLTRQLYLHVTSLSQNESYILIASHGRTAAICLMLLQYKLGVCCKLCDSMTWIYGGFYHMRLSDSGTYTIWA